MKQFYFSSGVILLTAGLAHADCKSELDAIMQAHLKSGPYHTTMEMVSSGKTKTIETDVILPSSFHMHMPEMEVILLKQGTWMKMGGTWKSMPAAMSAMTGNMMQDALAQGLKSASNFKCGATATFDGQTYPTYEFDSAATAMGMKVSSHITLYKGPNDLPAGIVVDGTAMGVHSVTTQHIKYDPTITINPPQ